MIRPYLFPDSSRKITVYFALIRTARTGQEFQSKR